ncbi:MAG: OsmC family protein [Sphingomonas sp.]
MTGTTVEYRGGLRCRAEHIESGVIVITDAPKDHHGLGSSFSPSDMLAVSLGSCILTIMGIAAQSMDIDIAGATATVEKEMANAPRRIARIAVAVNVPHNPTPDQVRKLEAAAHACPVHTCLDPALDTPISFTWGNSTP